MQTDKHKQLHDKYHSIAYSKTNILDGQFKGMLKIYEKMYGIYMPADKNAFIADIACGAGQFLKYLGNKGYSNYIGIDISPEQVAYVRGAVTDKVAEDNAFNWLSAQHDQYDLIVANDFIEHMTREQGIKFVGLVKDALKPGGRIILKTGNMAAFGSNFILWNGLDHECGYTERSLNTLLALHGYTDIEIIPDKPRRADYKLRAFLWALGWLYKNMYRGNYPKYLTKIIAVTGVK